VLCRTEPDVGGKLGFEVGRSWTQRIAGFGEATTGSNWPGSRGESEGISGVAKHVERRLKFWRRGKCTDFTGQGTAGCDLSVAGERATNNVWTPAKEQLGRLPHT